MSAAAATHNAPLNTTLKSGFVRETSSSSSSPPAAPSRHLCQESCRRRGLFNLWRNVVSVTRVRSLGGGGGGDVIPIALRVARRRP